MAHLEIRNLLQFVGNPMSEIKRSCRSVFERIAARRDMINMIFGASADRHLKWVLFEAAQ